VAAVSAFSAYETCERCQGTGYAPFIRAWGLYRFPCKPCQGTGQRERASRKIARLIRHGLRPSGEDY
jgi:DnaJ-class molecular chaperone